MSANIVEDNNGVIAKNNSGTINVTNGVSAEEAYSIVLKLFQDNFYRLQDVAIEYVKKRFDDFLLSFKEELKTKQFTDFDLFEKPDTQYALYDCMNAYAKYGDEVSLGMLVKIMSERLCSDKNFKVKIAIDDAIKIIPKLDQESLNYLTIMFAVKQVHFHLSDEVGTAVNHFNSLIELFPFNNQCADYLNSLGCLKIDLDSSISRISKIYKVDKKELEKHLDKRYLLIHGDYSLTYPAIVLAIINYKKKVVNVHFKFDTWIK